MRIPVRLLALALSVSFTLGTVPAMAQQPAAEGASRPGVLNRTPGRPAEPEAQDPAPAAPTSPPEGTGTAPPTRVTGANPGAGTPAPAGPRVLDVPDVAPDANEIGKNFVEPFDPLNPPRNVRVNIDFAQADLGDVVMWISALTGRNFIIADTISSQKKITIISPQPVTIAEAYRAFIAALNMNGLTVVPYGRFLKIVEAAKASREPLDPVLERSGLTGDDRMVTYIHQLSHVSISTVQPVLDALRSEPAQIIAYEPTNTMIITETSRNIDKLLGVLRLLDVPGGRESIYMYQVQHADADELKAVLLEIFQQNQNQGQQQAQRRTNRPAANNAQQAQPATDPAAAAGGLLGEGPASVSVSQIIADKRTNQLIIIANERSYQRILEIARQLDTPIPGEGQVHVIFLENANAQELAGTLQSLTQSVDAQRGQQSNTTRRTRQDANQPAPAASASSATVTFSGEVSITADESTNALVVVASLRDFLALQSVIKKLDRRRQQVYVEAVIMEVSLNRRNEFGMSVNGGYLPTIAGEQVPIFAATKVGNLSSLFLDPSSLMGLGVGARGPEIPGSRELLGISLPSFGAILQAAQTDNDVNVLSTPHILTLDNEEAEIVVGENIPFVSGISGGLGNLAGLAGLTGGSGATAGLDLGNLAGLAGVGGLGGLGGLGGVQVQRQDVALTLRLTPQINESNFVRLEMEVEVEDVQSIDPVLGPRTTTRQARATVVVQDQQTVVFGGLIRDTSVHDVNKVPLLGDIPVIGFLFRNDTTRTVKTNLMLLVTPYIIRDPTDFHEIYRRKLREREEFLAYFADRGPEYIQGIDYARKDGPMQSMFETILGARTEAEARSRAFSAPTWEQDVRPPVDQPLRFGPDTAPPTDAAPAPAPSAP